MAKIGFNCDDLFYKDFNHTKLWDEIMNNGWWVKTKLLYSLKNFVEGELDWKK